MYPSAPFSSHIIYHKGFDTLALLFLKDIFKETPPSIAGFSRCAAVHSRPVNYVSFWTEIFIIGHRLIDFAAPKVMCQVRAQRLSS